MFYNPSEEPHGLPHNPFKALVAPRPIGWISTISAEGTLNLAPYSFFNAVSEAPPHVVFGAGPYKDTERNVHDTGEFVCSLATYDLRDHMNATSAPVDHGISEFDIAELTPVPSTNVKPPRVGESPVALECVHHQTIELPGMNGEKGSSVVIGRVVGIHIDDDVLVDGLLDLTRIKPIARLGYKDYAVIDSLFSLNRPAGGGNGQ